MSLIGLFNILDLNKNGGLSRSEIHESAQRMGWNWNEAPVFAVLDLLTIPKPVSSILFPTTNGFREGVERVIDYGRKILVIAGCTLNSYARKSSIET